MILNFTDYNLVNESKTLKEFQKINSKGYTYQQIYDGFKNRGYSYYGTIYVEYKSVNNILCDEFLSVIPDDVLETAAKYAHKSKYLSFTPETDGISFYISDIAYKKLLPVLGDNDVENINACMKYRDLYYVLFNNEKKYFYFLNINSKQSRHWITGFIELWLKVRTSGTDVIRKELEDIASEWSEKERIENEEREEKERKRKEKLELEKERNDEFKRISDIVKNDVENNPDDYEDISYRDLPEEIKKSIDEKDGKYGKYIEHGKRDPYDRELATCYVNDENLTKGYKYKKEIDHSRTGTYWGD